MSDIERRQFLVGTGAAAAVALAARGAAGAKAAAPTSAPAEVHAEIEKALPQTVERIQRWIRQPSVSAQNVGITECCELTMELAREAGFQTVKKMPTAGHPGVFATLDAGAKRTLGLYFMYDVQPVDEKEWISPPWKAELVDLPEIGKVIMGRGAVNQKGPQGALLSALHAIRAAKQKLPVNLVLVAEGEEELGSPHFGEVVLHKEVVKALKRTSGVVMPGAQQSLSGSVAIRLGAKGIVYLELHASGARWGRGPMKRDLHSGSAAVVDSPVWRLIGALATMHGADGNEPVIDGITDAVRPTTDFEKQLYDAMAAREDEAELKKSMGVDRWIGDADERTMLERFGQRPTLNIDGIWAGYTGPGTKTILPASAQVKIDIRLVPNMTAKDVVAKVRKHLDKRGYTDIEIKNLGSYDPTETAADSLPIVTQKALYERQGVTVNMAPRAAGSWPGYLFTGKPLSKPATHFGMGYGNGAHSKDEFYVVEPVKDARFGGLGAAVKSFADFFYAFAAT
jgi:acetylornithine deacetylase/succinyl-diaminopimelate desuccinylase-like protein